MLTVGELFAGIGGIGLGLERAGMTVKWQVELDDYATKVLEKHWPDVARFRDVREIHGASACPVANANGSGNATQSSSIDGNRTAGNKGWQEQPQLESGGRGCPNCLLTVDLICGGFPCQDVSLAGKRAGLAGERTTLWSEFARLIRELEPRWVLAENVPGLLSSDDGRFFGNVLRDLATCGYDAEWDCIPAAAVGAPHRRYRVFIVAHAQRERDAGRLRSRAEQIIATNDAECCGEDVPNTDGREQGRRVKSQRGQAQRDTDAPGNGTQGEVADATGRGEAAGQQPGQLCGFEQGGEDVADANGRGCGDGKRAETFENPHEPQNRVLAPHDSSTESQWWAVEPDVGRVAHGVPHRVDRLRCLGNAVVPQVAEWVGRRIMEAEASAHAS